MLARQEEFCLADDIHLVAQNLLLGATAAAAGRGRRRLLVLGRGAELVLQQGDGAAEAGDGGGVGGVLGGGMLAGSCRVGVPGDVGALGVAGFHDLHCEGALVHVRVVEVRLRVHCVVVDVVVIGEVVCDMLGDWMDRGKVDLLVVIDIAVVWWSV